MRNPRTVMTIAAFVLVLCAVGAVFAAVQRKPEPTTLPAPTAQKSASTEPPPSVQITEEIRAVWMSFYELTLPNGMTRAAFTSKYDALFQQCEELNLNTIFIHVRPFTDAIYPSEYYPWSEILTGKQGQNPGYDPLAILCDLAKKHGLAPHAWINPFRAARTDDLTRLSAQNPALEHLNLNDGWVKKAAGQYFWNPAERETHALIYDGVRELLRNYDLAGIHIDDYFYPTTDASFDRAEYEAYQKTGGALSQNDWRRNHINGFTRGLYSAVKQADPDAVFSVSPAADIEKNYNSLYADAALWAREPGYCDWMIPQIYYGFENETMPFEQTAINWASLVYHEKCKLIFGLAAYKTGQEDEFAGSGTLEWTQHNDVLARQVKLTRGLLRCNGFALYSITNIASQERENLQIM